MTKGCGKEFIFKKEFVQLESENPNEELFEEQNFITICKKPLLCKECSLNLKIPSKEEQDE